MRQVTEFNDNTRAAAMQYVSAYLRDFGIRNGHLRFMQTLDHAPDYQARELAECIDVLLWVRDQEVFANCLELQQEPLDHEHWSAIH